MVAAPADPRCGAAGRPCTAARCSPRAASAAMAILAAAVAVGWFLPLFGISLLAFLVFDAVAGGVKRKRAAGRT